LKREVDQGQKDLELASQNLENVLLSHSIAPSDNQYERRFYSIKKERDDLQLKCVELQSQLDSMKNTAANAIAAFSGKKEENPSIDEGSEMSDSNSKKGGISRADSVSELTSLLEDMTSKMQINSAEAQIEAPLVLEFLKNLYKQKESEREAVDKQLEMVRLDIEKMEKKVSDLKKNSSKSPRKSKSPLGKRGRYQPESDEEDEQSAAKKIKLFDSRFSRDLESTYFSSRSGNSDNDSALQTFTQHLSTFTRFSNIESVATFGYRPIHDLSLMSCKVSAIEFDKEEEFIAVGGDLKEIQIFPYSTNDVESGAITEKVKNISPLQNMITYGNISGLSWSKHSRGQIACSDMSGVVSLWDASDASALVKYTEHNKNFVYCIDYSHSQAGILASGSADSTVRLWDVRQPDSTATIHSSGEVLCAKFNPSKDYELVYGNTNSLAYNYDIRKPDSPLQLFAEHKGAVCGVSFHKHDQIVTQSVDNSLKLWDVAHPEKAIRTFVGHHNTSKFTGLTCKRDHIAVGSEDNSVVVYSIVSCQPILRHSFETGIKEHDINKYVSAVCWNRHANTMLAGNDAGVIQICKLVKI